MNLEDAIEDLTWGSTTNIKLSGGTLYLEDGTPIAEFTHHVEDSDCEITFKNGKLYINLRGLDDVREK